MKTENLNHIVKGGASGYDIVIAGRAGPAVSYAAEELQRFIAQATGVTLAVRKETDDKFPFEAEGCRREAAGRPGHSISIGDTALLAACGITFDYGSLNTDGFFIKSGNGGNIFINGYNDRGCIYGVYELLERLAGMRFIAPDCTHVPELSEIVFDTLDIVRVPEFAMRIYFNGNLYGGEQFDEYHTRLRFCDSFITGKPAKYGGRSSMWGRRGCHNMHCYVPIEKYGETHPEFYYHYDDPFKAEAGNKEWHVLDLTNGITPDGKLDEFMPASVIKVAIDEMKIDIAANPDIDYFVFEQHDCDGYIYEPGSYGQAQVDKYGRSGVLVRFCNVLARELQAWADKELGGRKINIETFAYSYTKEPPVKEVKGKYIPIDGTVIAADNVVIRMAYFSNMYYDYFSPKQRPEIKKDMAGWKAVAKRFMFWAYDTDFQNYFWYCPTLHTAAANVRGFKKMGITYLAIEGSDNSKDDWQCLLKGYVYAKLMWDENADWRAIAGEFLNIYYGAAAPYVKKMIDMFDRHFKFLFSRFPGLDCYIGSSMYKEPDLYGEKLLNAAVRCIEDGERAISAQDISEFEKNVFLKRLARVKVTPVHMRAVKFAQQMFDTVERGGVEHFNSVRPIPPEHLYECDFMFNARSYILPAGNKLDKGPYIPDKAAAYRAGMPAGLVEEIEERDKRNRG